MLMIIGFVKSAIDILNVKIGWCKFGLYHTVSRACTLIGINHNSSMSQEYQRILDEVSKIVNEAPRLYEALGKDSWD